jgi:hypothetical protein
MKLHVIFLLIILLVTPACRSWRLFQKEVPTPVSVRGEELEALAKGAQWIERDYYLGHPNHKEGTEVAVAMSKAIGSPTTPAKSVDELLEELDRAHKVIAIQRQKIDHFLATQQGRTVEGSGFALLGFTGSYWFWLVVIIAFVLMGGGPILIAIIGRMRRTLIATTKAIEKWREDEPEVVARFEQYASRAMDRTEKNVIRIEKARAKREIAKDKVRDAA